jgi:hypothetical protein
VLEAGQGAQDLDLEGHVEVRCRRLATQVGLQPVEDQAVLDLLRLPDVGVEGLVGVVDVGQQDQQLEHVPVDLELHPRQVVDGVAEAGLDRRRVLDRAVDRAQRDRRVALTEPLHMLRDLRVSVLPRHTLILWPPEISHTTFTKR